MNWTFPYLYPVLKFLAVRWASISVNLYNFLKCAKTKLWIHLEVIWTMDSKLNSPDLNYKDFHISIWMSNISHVFQNHIPQILLNVIYWYPTDVLNSIISKPNIVFLLLLPIFISSLHFTSLHPHCYCCRVVLFHFTWSIPKTLQQMISELFSIYCITTGRYNMLPSITVGH